MAIEFSKDQIKVITSKGRNMLVSAAAGSGKTAVLVERIIRKVCDESNPIDIDSILVMTFTNAAAAEMRERIGKAIEEKAIENPESEHIARQAVLIHNAPICTIDSFCGNVVKNYFNEIGVEPTYRIADAGEAALLSKETMEEILEESFQREDEPFNSKFRMMFDTFSTHENEENVEEIISRLYKASQANPDPAVWLSDLKENLTYQDAESMMKSDWMRESTCVLKQRLTDCLSKQRKAVALSNEPDGPYMYGDLIESEAEKVEKALSKDDFFEMGDVLQTIAFDRLPTCSKKEAIDPIKQSAAKNARDKAKDEIKKICKEYYAFSKDTIFERENRMGEILITLVTITEQYAKRLLDKKKKKNVYEFDDIAHFTLQILTRSHADGSFEITNAAKAIASGFTEVMTDEYQDTSIIQERILQAISGEEEKAYHRFMVGDVKQSIYRFRQANPDLFLEKYHEYPLQEETCERIDLSKNFRSRAEVLNITNDIFKCIMQPECGGIEYDDAAKLYLGNESYPGNPEAIPELLLIGEPSKEEKQADFDGVKLEAEAVAAKIAGMVGKYMVTKRVKDPITGEKNSILSPCTYSDFAILLRAESNWSGEFKKALENRGIPAYIEAKTGYFESMEIQNVLQLLRVIGNPRQDIALFGTLKSVFGGFSEEEIAWIRVNASSRKTPLFSAMKESLQNNACDAKLKEKIQKYIQFIQKYRQLSGFMPVRDLLYNIFDEVSYLEHVSALPCGAKRRANVEMLLNKASDFEKTSYKGLFHFVKYMDQLEKYKQDEGEAGILDEADDVVRIMTIHKSKGLEFPIVFVCGLGKHFNRMDENGTTVIDSKLGIASSYFNATTRVKSKSIRREVIANRMREDSLAEELRVFYVALTRAKEKLVLTGRVSSKDKFFESIEKKLLPLRMREEIVLSHGEITDVQSYLDWILKALISHPCMEKFLRENSVEIPQNNSKLAVQKSDIRVNYICYSIGESEKTSIPDTEDGKNAPQDVANDDSVKTEEKMAKLLEKVGFSYEYDYLESLFTKTSVSTLKMAAIEEHDRCVIIPPSVEAPSEEDVWEEWGHSDEPKEFEPKIDSDKPKISGATRGSAMHRVMELLDLPELLSKQDGMEREKALSDMLLSFVNNKRLTKEYYEAVNKKKILQFLRSPLAKRMAEADKRGELYREQPFVFGVPANRFDNTFPEEEKVLIQGIIDVFFIEEGKVVLVDYKTDVMDSEEALALRYKVQFDYYEEALNAVFKEGVKERILYSFYFQKEIIAK